MNELQEAIYKTVKEFYKFSGPSDEARDDHGRWTGGGGGSSSKSENESSREDFMKKSADFNKNEKEHDRSMAKLTKDFANEKNPGKKIDILQEKLKLHKDHVEKLHDLVSHPYYQKIKERAPVKDED